MNFNLLQIIKKKKIRLGFKIRYYEKQYTMKFAIFRKFLLVLLLLFFFYSCASKTEVIPEEIEINDFV